MSYITIFTPTYNRESTLEKLYISLRDQSSKNFTWLIVDDGSTDNTYKLVQRWINDNYINIKYYYQRNQGKSVAHNLGVSLTNTELFTCVDSDDYLIDTAVEEIIFIWEEKHCNKYTGILAFKINENNKQTSTFKCNNIYSSNLIDAYRKYGLKGDSMLIYRSLTIKKFCFPVFENEKFVPEAYIYDLIDQVGELIIYKKSLYIYEYLENGYSKNMAKLIKNNPNGYIAFITQRLIIDNKIKDKISDTIRYTSLSIYIKKSNIIKNSIYPILTVLSAPISYILYYIRYKDKN